MRENEQRKTENEWVAGRNAVSEVLRSGRAVDHILVARGDRSGSLQSLVARARERGIPIKEADPKRLDALCGGGHQGIALLAACKETVELEELLELAAARLEPPFLVICDGIEDPHNLGAIIRTAEAAGAHGVVIPKRRSAGLTGAVYKSSAGAVEHLPVARVSNLVDALKRLKEQGVWVYGLDMDGTSYDKAEIKGAAALVVGSEGKGMGRLVREQCDYIVSLPMAGRVESLNASVACGILLYEVARQRRQTSI